MVFPWQEPAVGQIDAILIAFAIVAGVLTP